MSIPLAQLISLSCGHKVYNLCRPILEDWRLPLWSGSSKITQHHYGKGGLIAHTLEVAELCFHTNDFLPQNKKVNEVELFLAAFFHDVGKMDDYEPAQLELGSNEKDYNHWRSANHKYKIHHISRSSIVFNECFNKNPIPGVNADEVLHAILAHHGRREWGSPAEPKTRLAWLLHLCDGISARIDDVDKQEINRFRG